jgi:dipeptidyl-peptidase-4
LLLFISGIIYNDSMSQTMELKLEDIWSSRQFVATGLPDIRSMKDGVHYTELITKPTGQFIVKTEYRSGRTVDTLFRASSLANDGKSPTISDYSISEDETLLLVATESEPIYRHSTRADHYVIDLESRKVTPVSEKGKQMYASFSPAGNAVAFVRDNNLCIKDLVKNTESQVTTDGKKNEIINGATDWVYEEEFSFDQGYQWSPDGRFLAYYRFDETEVKEFNLTYYGSLYPREEKYKYPKAGEANAKVEIRIYDVKFGKTVATDVQKETDQYIPRIKWTADPGKLCIMRMNRLQNLLELYSCDAVSGLTTLMFSETNPAYIEISDDFAFLDNKKEFIWTSTRDGYNHIYLYDLTGRLIRQVTEGNWDVTEFYGIDETTMTCFYQAAKKSPMEKQVFATDAKGHTRLLSPDPGTTRAKFSSNFKYGFLLNSGIDRPYLVTLIGEDGKKIRDTNDNASVKLAMKQYDLRTPEFFTFTTTEGVVLNGWMIKPSSFSSDKRYPVIQYMYGGPGSQTVKDEWMGMNYFWFQYLASKGYIVVSVDNRGTGARGEAFNKCIYKKLGHLETIDQVETAKWLAKQKYVDGSRIGAWGWSYGGYMTSLLMTKGADHFKAAIAVAPVTNWRFYDSIYTERYLQTPQQNPDGYDQNSPIHFGGLMKGKFLVIHGTADDNVHLQNSMEFTSALVKENKPFEQFFYPDKAHGITGVRMHLYVKMTGFFLENL